MNKLTNQIDVPMTLLEANALLRLIGIANMSPDAMETDKSAGTWVAERIVRLLNGQ
jgi:hypothetical protein